LQARLAFESRTSSGAA